MTSLMRPELHAAAGNTASFQNRLDSTYKSGNVVQTSGATSGDVCIARTPGRNSLLVEGVIEVMASQIRLVIAFIEHAAATDIGRDEE